MYKKLNLQRYTEDTGRWFKLKKKYVHMSGALEPTPQPTNLFRYEYEFILDAKLHVEEASPPPANPPRIFAVGKVGKEKKCCGYNTAK